jgi:hypothetical protein
MSQSIDERIASLEIRLAQLQATAQRLATRRRTVAARQSRATETRRKILVGASVLAAIEHGEPGWSHAALVRLLDAHLSRADDRALFTLSPRTEG